MDSDDSKHTGPGHPHPPAKSEDYTSVAAGTAPDPRPPERDPSWSPRVGTDQAAKHVVPDGVQNAAPKEAGPEMPMGGNTGDTSGKPAGGADANAPRSGESGRSAPTNTAGAAAATGSPKAATGAAPKGK